jgi:hypothetical protein
MDSDGPPAAKVPKVVHYCWFGGHSKPKAVLAMLESWRRILPSYSFVEWNEGNFDVSAWRYAKEAHRVRKYPFVSDVARMHALATQGGVYLDTDVEVLRPFDPLLNGDTVLGFEEFNFVATSTLVAAPGSGLMERILDSYRGRCFIREDGKLDLTTNVELLTRTLLGLGLRRDGTEQVLHLGPERIRVLDQQKFSPVDYPNRIDKRDTTTFAVHYFGQSWASPVGRARRALREALISVIGGKNLKRLRRSFSDQH